MSGGDVVLVAVDDGVATITLNRPDARNAINGALGVGLARAVAECEADDAVAAMILTGADPAFCAGADLKEISSAPTEVRAPDPDDPYRRDEIGKYAAFRGPFPPHVKPLIGAINGACITGGFEIALNCDFLIASERARFADTHARVGIMPGWGLTVRLPARIGVTRAREMSFTGNFVDAPTALQWGLVNHVVPHDQLLPTTLGLAADIAGNDAAAVDQLRRVYDEGEALDADPRWAVERRTAGRMPGGFDADALEARRRAVIERGRQQTDTPDS